MRAKKGVIRRSRLKPEFHGIRSRIVTINSGFGCDPGKSGTAIFVTFDCDGERARFSRFDIEYLLEPVAEEAAAKEIEAAAQETAAALQKTRNLKPGDKIMIYEDPFTEEKPEGEVVLVEKLIDHGEEQEYWEVRFVGPDWQDTYKRWIRVMF